MVDQILDNQVSAWLEKNREQILSQFMALIRIPSVCGNPQPGAPFGAACAQALETAGSYFSEKNIPVRFDPENRYAIAQIGSGAKCISIFGHSDVVPAGDGWQFAQPFEPVIREGMLLGRGSSDNKNGVMASFCALTMLKEFNIPLHNRIQAFIGSNEENGMADIIAFAENEPMPDICLVPDSRFPCSLGEKGIMQLWVKCDLPFTDILDMRGGSAFNIIIDHADTVLSPNNALARELQEKCAGHKEYTLQVQSDGTILLGVDGVSQHAAYPEDSINASWLTAKLLADCEHLNPGDRQILRTVATCLEGYCGEGLGIAYPDAEFGDLTVANGMIAVENGHLKLSMDIRYGAGKDPQQLENELHSRWQEKGWQIVFMNNRPGFRVDPNSPVPPLLKEIYRTLSGNNTPFYFMQGGSYSRYLKNAYTVGSRALAAGRQSNNFLPKGHGGPHQKDEAVDIESFFLAVRVLTHYVLACDRLLSQQP